MIVGNFFARSHSSEPPCLRVMRDDNFLYHKFTKTNISINRIYKNQKVNLAKGRQNIDRIKKRKTQLRIS